MRMKNKKMIKNSLREKLKGEKRTLANTWPEGKRKGKTKKGEVEVKEDYHTSRKLW